MQALVLESGSPERTARIGAALGAALAAGDVVALAGDLGAGKTALAKGVAEGLRVPEGQVRSPTFTLVHRYGGGLLPLVHVDAYRLPGAQGLIDLGLEEVFDPGAAALVEWAPRVEAALPADRLDALLEHAGPTSRRMTFTARGERSAALLDRFRARLET